MTTKPKETKLDFTDDEVIEEDRPVPAEEQDEDIVDEDLDALDRLPKEATRNTDGSVTLKLHFPVTLKTKKNGKVRERVFEELIFYRLTGASFRAINAAGDEHQTSVALAQSTRLNNAVANALYDRMVDVDIANSGRVLNNFFASGPKAGKQSSG